MPVGRSEPAGTGRFQEMERAVENIYFAQEERLLMLKRLEGLVKQGKLDQSTYDKIKAVTGDPHHCIGVEVLPGKYQDVATEMHDKPDPNVYRFKPGDRVPTKEEIAAMQREAFIPHHDIDVPDIKVSPAEAARLAKAAARQEMLVEPPTLFGFRVLPRGMTPGRTYILGTVLAVWGTAALLTVGFKEMFKKPHPEVAELAGRLRESVAK